MTDIVDTQQTTPEGDDGQPNPGAIRKSTTQGILKAASNATGMEFHSVEDMMAALARLSAQSAGPIAQSPQPSQPSPSEPQSSKLKMTDLQDQFLSLKRELEVKEQRLRETELLGNIRNSLGDRFDPDLLDYTTQQIRGQLKEVDGQWAIVDGAGRVRYNSEGQPMSIQNLAEELAKRNPKLLRQTQSAPSGPGLRPNGLWSGGVPGVDEAVPDYTTNPAAFNAWAAARGLGKGVGLRGISATVSNSTPKR